MKDTEKSIETLIERATDYGKTSYKLIKYKTIDKTSDIISSFIPHTVVFVLIASFMLFASLGFSLWIGEILGKIYYGFFAIAVFYCFIAIIFRLFMYKWIKRIACNCIIKQATK